MEGQINVLKDLQSVMTKALASYKKSPKDRLTVEYIETRLELLENDWSLFKDTKSQLYKNYKLEDVIQKVADIYDTTEDTYITYKCAMKSALNKLKAKEAIVQQGSESNKMSRATSSLVKLPKISIPTFSGKYSEWTTFYDLFTSLVHNNPSLDNVQKMHYLKGHLTGEAEQLIRHTPITDANYNQCWLQLERRYANKKYLTNCILKRLFSQKRLLVESASGLKELLDTTTDCLSALTNLKIDVSTWDVIIIHIVTFQLDNETRKQWELSISTDSSNELPTLEQFKKFIEGRFRALEFIEPKKVHQGSNIAHAHSPKAMLATKTSSMLCEYCSESHKLCFCKKFANQSVDDRREFVAKNKICFNCLGSNHTIYDCKKQMSCRICKKRHHSLLHLNRDANTGMDSLVQDTATKSAVDNNSTDDSQIVACLSTGKIAKPSQVLLATALIKAESKTGQFMTVRALLDQGSQACFITEATVQLLRLKKSLVSGVITGLGNNRSTTAKYMVTLTIKSKIDDNFQLKINAYVLNKITSYLPEKSMNISSFDWIDSYGLSLADPNFNTPNRIDILLGADAYASIIKEGIVRSPTGTLIAQSTALGWILSGLVASSNDKEMQHLPKNISVNCAHFNEDNLLRFWEIEEQKSSKKILNPEEQRCEELYTKTKVRDDTGRYVVHLPFRNDDPACKGGSSRYIAEMRLKSLEKRLSKDTCLMGKYIGVINGYLQLGHLRPVKEGDDKKGQAVYLPHHAVVRDDKTNTKVRVVFNASEKNKKGMEQQKWNSNNQEIMKIIDQMKETEEEVEQTGPIKKENKNFEIKLDSTIKILGLTWNRNDDSFQYTANLAPLKTAPVTKRKVISDIARLFYPLGWLAPSVGLAKSFMLRLWLAGVSWDEALNKKVVQEWNTYREELTLLTKVRIPRWLRSKFKDKLELHGFSDTSKIAYSAVVYLRVPNAVDGVHVSLLVARTRVVPIKQVNIPRLELCGAVLLTRLLIETEHVLNSSREQVKVWTDSTVVLSWLNSHPSRWKTFATSSLVIR
uniref:SFRICE_041182 n=1 Tax=Spodoptera frugiperda TaxID=7108 RepID=A0A2H1WI74_SPOFR